MDRIVGLQRKGKNIDFQQVCCLLVDWSGLATKISKASVDVSWVRIWILDDEIKFEDIPDF